MLTYDFLASSNCRDFDFNDQSGMINRSTSNIDPPTHPPFQSIRVGCSFASPFDLTLTSDLTLEAPSSPRGVDSLAGMNSGSSSSYLPLRPHEIREAALIVRTNQSLGDDEYRFISIELHEPTKHQAISTDRKAFIILLNTHLNHCFEAIVNITASSIEKFDRVIDAQPALTPDDYLECELAVKSSEEFKCAMAKRGIHDMDMVMIDLWSVGRFYLGEESDDESGLRLGKPLVFLRMHADGNGYAHPIDSVTPVVDLCKMKVIRVDDSGVVPIPKTKCNLHDYDGKFSSIRPFSITQPDGTCFRVRNENEVTWLGWDFMVGFTAREGLVLHKLSFQGKDVIYRASVAEMVVPYGHPGSPHYRKNAFDAGEEGLGYNVTSLKRGEDASCDCAGNIHYFDAHFSSSKGMPVTVRNAVCMHEEDIGVFFKHTDWRTGKSVTKRGRRLSISFFIQVANYAYGFYWNLYEDGSIECNVKLTGILNSITIPSGYSDRYHVSLSNDLGAPVHQHFFCLRLDMNVAGTNNTVEEVNIQRSTGPEVLQKNAFYPEHTIFEREGEAARRVQPGRYWRVINENCLNETGKPVAYRVVPSDNVVPFADPTSSVMRRAGFIQNHLWVTPFDPAERYPTGEYPNQNARPSGLPSWIKQDREIRNRDLVIWYVIGSLHVPRLEEWPLMPAATAGVKLMPDGFCNRNPASNSNQRAYIE